MRQQVRRPHCSVFSVHNQATHEELVQEAPQEIKVEERLIRIEQLIETAMLMQPQKPEELFILPLVESVDTDSSRTGTCPV
jgi:hypothetical protein